MPDPLLVRPAENHLRRATGGVEHTVGDRDPRLRRALTRPARDHRAGLGPSGAGREVVVSGVRDQVARERVLKRAGRAVDALDLDGLRVEFRGALKARRGWVAGASRDGIRLRRSLLDEVDERLGLVLYEEAAHHKLCLVGVPGDAHGIFLHELYATWFGCRQ